MPVLAIRRVDTDDRSNDPGSVVGPELIVGSRSSNEGHGIDAAARLLTANRSARLFARVSEATVSKALWEEICRV